LAEHTQAWSDNLRGDGHPRDNEDRPAAAHLPFDVDVWLSEPPP